MSRECGSTRSRLSDEMAIQAGERTLRQWETYPPKASSSIWTADVVKLLLEYEAAPNGYRGLGVTPILFAGFWTSVSFPDALGPWG